MEQRRACRLRTTYPLDDRGLERRGEYGDWNVNAVLHPWSGRRAHLGLAELVRDSGQGDAHCAQSQHSGTARAFRQLVADPPACVNASAPSTVVDLGTGTKYVPRPGDPIPPHIVPEGSPPPLHWAVINPKNAWLVSDGYTLVAVYAGSPGKDPSLGRFAIVRQNAIFGVQYAPPDIVDVGKVGALTITTRPAGRVRRDVSSARQARDSSRQNGTKGILDLSADRVRITARALARNAGELFEAREPGGDLREPVVPQRPHAGLRAPHARSPGVTTWPQQARRDPRSSRGAGRCRCGRGSRSGRSARSRACGGRRARPDAAASGETCAAISSSRVGV